MSLNHPVFTTPHKVDLSFVDRQVPHYYRSRLSGRNLGETMPMWQVQTEGFSEEETVMPLVGTVSYPMDKSCPDTEFISGGENMKMPDAVAIGRQGNYLHWGFAASPNYLTEEAKLVFVNAIHYISQFDGQYLFAHRAVVGTRASLDEDLYLLSDEGFAAFTEKLNRLNERFQTRAKQLREKQNSGETLTRSEEARMKFNPIRYTRMDLVDETIPESVLTRFDEDWPKLIGYLNENRRFMTPDSTGENSRILVVDEDAKRLDLANNDLALLERCIQLLETGESEALALRLLKRYTNESFSDVAQWRGWFDENQKHLWFNEEGGYKFEVIPDRFRNRVEARHVAAMTDKEAVAAFGSPFGKSALDSINPVHLSASFEQKVVDAGDEVDLIIDVKMEDGWHIYRSVPENIPMVPVKVSMLSTEFVDAVGECEMGEGVPYLANPEMLILNGDVQFTQKVRFGKSLVGKQSVKLKVAYQVCNNDRCKAPTEQELTATIDVKARQ